MLQENCNESTRDGKYKAVKAKSDVVSDACHDVSAWKISAKTGTAPQFHASLVSTAT